jgi:hypothetical protein
MAIDVEWQDEDGEQLARYDGPAIDTRLFSRAAEGSPCLRFVDPYGDTVFNSAQVAALEQELASISTTGGELAAQASSLLEFVRMLEERTHCYLKFIGD